MVIRRVTTNCSWTTLYYAVFVITIIIITYANQNTINGFLTTTCTHHCAFLPDFPTVK